MKLKDFQNGSRVALTSSIFPRSTEFLDECYAHWSSDAVEIELHGLDHDYFTLRILVFGEKYQAEFHWITDVLPDKQVIIEPTRSELKLSSRDFKKGYDYHGLVRFKGICKGSGYDGKTVELNGHFAFKIP